MTEPLAVLARVVTRPVYPADLSPSRFAAGVAARPEGCRVAILGLPDDLGVRLNGGRPGAALGPGAVRAALARYGVARPEGWAWPGVFDAGDVVPASADGPPTADHAASVAALNETHRRVTVASRALAAAGLIPVGIGGGHDLTFPFVRGVIEARREASGGAGSRPGFAGVYFDAHLDVRDTPGSGMPFRRLVEDCGVSSLRCHGMDPFAATQEHAAWFRGHTGSAGGDEPPPGGSGAFPGDPVFVSMDLDVLDASAAPGVSAPNPSGWPVARLAAWARLAGSCPAVRCFDLMELCPPHDESGRTARVAAYLLLSFLRGVADRPA